MVMRYGPRLWKLRVLQAELKMTIRSSPNSSTQNIRLCLANDSGYYLDINTYTEACEPQTGIVRPQKIRNLGLFTFFPPSFADTFRGVRKEERPDARSANFDALSREGLPAAEALPSATKRNYLRLRLSGHVQANGRSAMEAVQRTETRYVKQRKKLIGIRRALYLTIFSRRSEDTRENDGVRGVGARSRKRVASPRAEARSWRKQCRHGGLEIDFVHARVSGRTRYHPDRQRHHVLDRFVWSTRR